MADPAIVTIDLEFKFTDGELLFIDLIEGRDSVSADDACIQVIKHPDERTIEDTLIARPKLNWQRATKRLIDPPTVDDVMDPK